MNESQDERIETFRSRMEYYQSECSYYKGKCEVYEKLLNSRGEAEDEQD